MNLNAERPVVVAIGNSHINAVLTASKAADVPVQLQCLQFLTAAYAPYWRTEDGVRRPNRQYLAHAHDLIERAKPVAIICFAASNLSFDVGSVKRPRPFDFVLPSRQDLPLYADEIIPHDLMMERALAAEREWGQLMAPAMGLPVWSVCPPAPIVSFDPFLPKMVHQIKNTIAVYGVAPDTFRRKMWLLQTEANRRVAQEFGAAFLGAPPETVNDAGLRPIDYAHDPLHGNTAYGRLVLQQIAKIIEGEDSHAPL